MSRKLVEYHLIDLSDGLSHGGFESLEASREYARQEGMLAWEIFRGNIHIERHDPRETDPRQTYRD